jgi:aspartyl-tRNA(Asn)/glutamyl-tRNA(Gln) amidotransferase subunit A
MVFIGYTATPEFSWKLVTDSPKYGTVLNPNDPQRTAGGSSGGAAASAAAGIAPVNLGSDAAGSIRVPASFCGVFGMKPTFGTVAAYPAGPLSHVGPLGRDIGDAAMVLDAIGRPDRRDWYNTPFSRQDAFSRKLGRPLRGLRIAYTSSLCGLDALPEVRTAVERIVPALEGMGATVKETEPTVADPREAARVLFSGGYVNRFRAMDESSRARADSGLVAFAEAAKTYTADDVRRAYEQRYLIGCQFSLFFENFDLLVTPTTICPAFKLGQNAPDGFTDDIASWSVFTYIFNLTQNPAASVPWGRLANGLPIGVQIVGPKFGDADVLMASKAFCDLNPLS